MGGAYPSGFTRSGLGASDTELFIGGSKIISLSLATGQLNPWVMNQVKGKILVHNGKVYAQKSTGGQLIVLDAETKQVLTGPEIFVSSDSFNSLSIAADGNSIYMLGSAFTNSNHQFIGNAIAFDATNLHVSCFHS